MFIASFTKRIDCATIFVLMIMRPLCIFYLIWWQVRHGQSDLSIYSRNVWEMGLDGFCFALFCFYGYIFLLFMETGVFIMVKVVQLN